MKAGRIIAALLALFCLASCHRGKVNEIMMHGKDLSGGTEIEILEFPFSEELLDTTISVRFVYPDDAVCKVVPWGVGDRTRVGYSYSADTIYFAYAFSQPCLKVEGNTYTFRRKFDPTLKVLIGRSRKSIAYALTEIQHNLDKLGDE